jgi:hypothetical protein
VYYNLKLSNVMGDVDFRKRAKSNSGLCDEPVSWKMRCPWLFPKGSEFKKLSIKTFIEFGNNDFTNKPY